MIIRIPLTAAVRVFYFLYACFKNHARGPEVSYMALHPRESSLSCSLCFPPTESIQGVREGEESMGERHRGRGWNESGVKVTQFKALHSISHLENGGTLIRRGKAKDLGSRCLVALVFIILA